MTHVVHIRLSRAFNARRLENSAIKRTRSCSVPRDVSSSHYSANDNRHRCHYIAFLREIIRRRSKNKEEIGEKSSCNRIGNILSGEHSSSFFGGFLRWKNTWKLELFLRGNLPKKWNWNHETSRTDLRRTPIFLDHRDGEYQIRIENRWKSVRNTHKKWVFCSCQGVWSVDYGKFGCAKQNRSGCVDKAKLSLETKIPKKAFGSLSAWNKLGNIAHAIGWETGWITIKPRQKYY